jgi:hypothetical protein
MQDGLVLRDLHRPPAPSLWPPAPGWWIVVALVLAAATVGWWLHARRRKRRNDAIAMFDAAIANTGAPAQEIAAASELLRRAARAVRADADRLAGDDWLAFLDRPRMRFVDGPGRLLLDGAFRPSIARDDADAAIRLARARFVELMVRRR